MNKLLLYTLLFLGLTACSSDDNTPTPTPQSPFSNGVLIVNEGAFGTGTGTIQFYNTGARTITSDLFLPANNRPLGNIAQSIIKAGSEYWIAVNNAEKVEVTDENLKSVSVISNLKLPDHCYYPGGDKVYVTEWESFTTTGNVVVINKNTKAVIKRIDVGELPSQMLAKGNQLLVVNSGDSTLSILDRNTDNLLSTVTVGDRPNGVFVDAAGSVWVLCGGKLAFTGQETAGSLVRLNANLDAVNFRYTFPQTTDHPENLTPNLGKDGFYFSLNGMIYSMSSQAAAPGSTNTRVNAYKMHLDAPRSRLYVTDAGNFSSPGKVYTYSLPNLTLVDSIVAGVIPRAIWMP